MKAMITNIKRFAVHDGDGIRTTVFFKGCPLKCVWCHNPETLDFKSQMAFYKHKCIGCGMCLKKNFTTEDCLGGAKVLYGEEISADYLLQILLEDKDFYENSGGGVTLSGGECLCQPDFCANILEKLKESGINTAIDTCGFVTRESIDKVLNYTDVFLYDVKAIDEDVHIKCTGHSNKQIIENIKYIDSKNKAIEVRIPYVPNYNDNQIDKIADFLTKLNNLRKVKVLPYHNYAASKYAALGMVNNLPKTMPTDKQIKTAEKIIAHKLLKNDL